MNNQLKLWKKIWDISMKWNSWGFIQKYNHFNINLNQKKKKNSINWMKLQQESHILISNPIITNLNIKILVENHQWWELIILNSYKNKKEENSAIKR